MQIVKRLAAILCLLALVVPALAQVYSDDGVRLKDHLALGPAEGFIQALRMRHANLSAPVLIATIQPSGTWNGAAGSGGTLPAALNPATAAPLGTQSVSAVSSSGGLIQLTVSSTANITDGEQWLAKGIGPTMDGFYKVQVVDLTHVNLCGKLTGNIGSYTCTGSTYAAGYTSGGTLSFPQKVVGVLDDYRYVFIETTDHTICVGAAAGTRAWIKEVDFYLEGTMVPVTQQAVSLNHGTQGWCVTPTSRTTGAPLDGDAILAADIIPVNGFDRVVSMPLTLNTNGRITRPDRYVDCVNGNDTTGTGLTASTAWATIKKAFSASPGTTGALVHVAVPSATVTVSIASPAVVTWAGNTLKPGYGFQFSTTGTLPTGVTAGQTYYVITDGFSAGASFEFSKDPPGNASTTAVTLNGATVNNPINTSGTQSGVHTGFGGVCTDLATDPGLNNNTRLITVQANVPRAITITRASRNPTAGHTWASRANRAHLSGFTVDMSKIVSFTGSGSADGQMAVENSSLIDPNGADPAFGYAHVNQAGAADVANFAGAFNMSSAAMNTALVESTLSSIAYALPRLTRNVTATQSYDMTAIGTAGGGYNNTGAFNLRAHKHGNFLGRIHPETSLTISAVGAFSGGVTPITVTGWSSLYTGDVPDTRLVFYSGAYNGTYKPVSAINNTTGVLTVTGDATAAVIGDVVYAGIDEHSDQFQIVSWTCTQIAPLENVYYQRYNSTMDYPLTDSYQALLGQSGSCGATGNITVAGTAVTFGASNFIQPYDVVGVSRGFHSRVDASTATGAATTATLVAPIPGLADGTYTSWTRGNTSKDIAIVNSIMDANGLFQPQNGQQNWIFANDTIVGGGQFSNNVHPISDILFRDDNVGFNNESFAFFDTLLPSYNSSNATFPAGTATDNVAALNTGVGYPFLDGENSADLTGTGITFNADYSTNVLSKLLRSGVPIMHPWDIYGNPRTSSSHIGAVN